MVREGNSVLRYAVAAVVVAAAGFPTLTLSQAVKSTATRVAGQAADSTDTISEVVVTARRRVERAIDVPASLSVFGGDALETTEIGRAHV